MVLNALGWEPSAAWGRDAQGDISGKTPAILPLDLPAVPELLAGAKAQVWEHVRDRHPLHPGHLHLYMQKVAGC